MDAVQCSVECRSDVMSRCLLNDDRDVVFPDGNKLPSTNLPTSATGPVQRFVVTYSVVIWFHRMIAYSNVM